MTRSHLWALPMVNVQFFKTARKTIRGSGRRRAGKRKGVGREKIGTDNSKNKKSKFWLMRMHQIKILHIFLLFLGKYISLAKNSFFSAKLRPIQSHCIQKTGFTVKTTVFSRPFGRERVKAQFRPLKHKLAFPKILRLVAL